MITDADWNEMVRILKHRMDRTVGASIASGSPREGGILTEEIANKKWTLSDKKFVAVEKLRWGRVYVDGMYGEIRPLDQEDLNKLGLSEEEQIKITDEPSIMAFLAFQRDYHRLRMITQNRPYVAYIDLWERLVIGLEDKKLNDSALHGADTCVRTQTMSQVKLAEIVQESFEKGAEDWKPPAECGNAMLGVEKITADPATSNVCDRETQKIEEYRQRNTLFRLEVHTAYEKGGKHKVILKWSSENGAEQHKNDPDLPNFWDYDHTYECHSDLSEKLMGVQKTSPGGSPGILEKAELYTYRNYKEKCNNEDSAARKMTYVRRWDGYLTLERMDNSESWDLAEQESHPNATIDFETITSGEDAQKLIINDVIDGHNLEFVIARWIKKEGEPRKKQSCLFVSGDYWLVLVRDQGSEVNAEVLSHEPVGIHHQYLVLGVFKVPIEGPSHLRLTSQQWRRLSFPSLTNLTLDRVLVEDENANESSVTDEINKCVKKAGDTMTGSLKFADTNDRVGMTLSTCASGGPRIQFDPPKSGPEAAWIKASTKQVETGRRTTMELGVSDDGLDDILLNASGDILLDANYNVGIGTKAPHAKLDVKGPVRIDSRERTDQATENEPEPQASGSLAGRGFLETPWVYTGHLQALSGDLSLTANKILLDAENYVDIGTKSPSGKVVLQETGGDVGIGINEPGAKLDIDGEVLIRGGKPAKGKILTCKNSEGNATWKDTSEIEDLIEDNAVLIWLGM